MKLSKLIAFAAENDKEFLFKINYWVNVRNKTPTEDWLRTQLVNVLGEKFMIDYLTNEDDDEKST